MLSALCLTVSLTVGQAADPTVPSPPDLPRSIALPQTSPLPSKPTPVRMNNAPGRAVITIEPLPTTTLPTNPIFQQPAAEEPKKDNGNGEEKKEDEEEKDEPEKGLFMKAMEGTPLGCWMEQRKISFSGWTQMSYTGSQTSTTNLPVTWNDRANRFLLQQHWMRLEKAIDTESKEASFGWRIDGVFGTDYRFMLMRGLFNQQLENSTGAQNLYGFDLPQFYVNGYFPNLFEGTEVQIGRMGTCWGYESVEGPSSPLLSRSYAFNWAPPFFHLGIMVMPKFSKNWSGKFMLANGNDVFIDPAEEIRFVGSLTWTSDDEKDTVAFGTTFGRGKMNVGEPYAPATVGLQTEPAGRNNINVFDLVWKHTFTECFSYGLELIYGYQTGVPVGVPGGIVGTPGTPSGTAHWASCVNYFNYKWNDKLSSVLRAEVFDDFEGQRTGFEGLYTAVTFGVQWKPKDWLWMRPEIRYDVNTDNAPFEGGRRSLWTASTDLIIRW